MVISIDREMRVIQRVLIDPPSGSSSPLQIHNGIQIPFELIQRYAKIIVLRFLLRFPTATGFVEVIPRVADFETEVLGQPFIPVSYLIYGASTSLPAYLARTPVGASLAVGSELIFFADSNGKTLQTHFPIVCRRLSYNL